MIKLSLRGSSEELDKILKHISFDDDVMVLCTSHRGKCKDMRIYFYIELKDDAELRQ